MKMKLTTIITKSSLALTIGAIALTTACQPEEFDGNGNGILSPALDPAFTVTPVEVEGKLNTYVFRINKMENVIGVRWDLGEGAFASGYERTDTVFFPDADTYSIRAEVQGIGGKTFGSSQTLDVATSDPNAGNALVGAKFNVGDEDKWSTLSYSGGVAPAFRDGRVYFEGGGWGHAGIFQQIQLEGGKKYKLDMSVFGSGASDTWFEVYIGQAVPVGGGGNDYNDGGTRLGINTWTGCGKTAFADKLTKVGCVGSAKDTGGEITFEQGGTYYLVIRTGGASLGTEGISVDNVELRPVN
jgi:hypothetical protein